MLKLCCEYIGNWFGFRDRGDGVRFVLVIKFSDFGILFCNFVVETRMRQSFAPSNSYPTLEEKNASNHGTILRDCRGEKCTDDN